MVDAADLAITGLDSLDPTRPLAAVRASQVPVPDGPVAGRATRADVTSAGRGGVRCRSLRGGRTGRGDRGGVRQDPAPVRPADRPVPGGKHRCARMLTAAEQAAAAAWDAAAAWETCPSAGNGRDASQRLLRRCGGRGRGAGRRGQLHPRVHPGPRRDRLHLGASRPLYYRRALSLRALLGPAATGPAGCRAAWPRGAQRPVRVDLPVEAGPLRAGIRAELAAIAALEPPGAHPAAGRRRLGGPAPARPWGRAAGPLEQLVIAEEMKRAAAAHPGTC